MARLPTRTTWLLAATSGIWSAALLLPEWPTRWPLALALGCAFAAAVRVGCRRAWPGTLLTAAGVVLLGLLGVPSENAAPLAPGMITLLIAGYLLPWRAGIWSVPLLLVSMGAAAAWDAPSVVFGGVLLLLPWTFGAVIRARDARRRLAAAEALRLALVDPATHARAAAVTEREEVARTALGVVDGAVARMTTTARDARARLNRSALENIHDVGTEATRELRALLLVLRHDQDPVRAGAADPGARTDVSAVPPDDRQRWRAWAGLAWPALLVLMDVGLSPVLMSLAGETARPSWPPPLPLVVFVALPVAVAVVLRAAWPVWSTAGTAAVVLLGWSTGVVDVVREGLWLAIAGAALSWSAGRVGTRGTVLSWLALTATVVALHALDSPENLPIHLTMFVLPFAAGAAWAGHHAAEGVHLDAARLRRAEIDAAERSAVSEARLQLARDLHDAASHAVGSMMMQANAARVLSQRDPAGARAALDAIVEIGTEADRELREMSGDRDAGTRQVPHTSTSLVTEELSDGVRSLVAAARRTGSRVTADLGETTGLTREELPMVLRVVREGLANASRHAPGSEVRVEVDVSQGQTRVRVRNGPPRPTTGTDRVTGSGLGLRGLREQLAVRTGRLEASAIEGDPSRGWVMVATFPTAARPPSPSAAQGPALAPQEAQP